MVHLPFFHLIALSHAFGQDRKAEIEKYQTLEDAVLPEYIFLREKSSDIGESRRLTAYDEHGKSMWDFPIANNIFMYSQTFENDDNTDGLRHKYIEGLFYNKEGKITKVHFHEDSEFDELEDLDHILSIENNTVESYSDCQKGVPCVVVFKEQLMYKIDARDGTFVQYLVKGKPTFPSSEFASYLTKDPSKHPEQYLLIGTQSVVTKHIWDDNRQNTIAIIEEQSDFEFRSDYRGKHMYSFEVDQFIRRSGETVCTFRGYSDKQRKVKMWNEIEEIGSEISLEKSHIKELPNSSQNPESQNLLPHVKEEQSILKEIEDHSMDQDNHWLKDPSLEGDNLSNSEIEPGMEVEVVDDWNMAITLTLITIIGIGSLCYIGNKRHRDFWRYLKFTVVYGLMRDFFVHIKSFNKVRKRRISASNETSIKIAEDLMVPDLYHEMPGKEFEKLMRDLDEKNEELERLRRQSDSVSTNFESKYEREFETKNVLGKGGFGVVFEALNKNDKSNYAIKRIELPRCATGVSKERIEREFKALMVLRNKDLNTRHFIDYYQCWQEKNVPKDWVADHDRQFKSQLSNYDSLSVLDKSESRIEDQISEQLTRSAQNSVASGLKLDFSMNEDVVWEGDSDGSWGNDSNLSASDTSDTHDGNCERNKSSKTSDSGLFMFKTDRSNSIRHRKLTEIQRTESTQSNASSSIVFESGDGSIQIASESQYTEDSPEELSDSISLANVNYNHDTVDFLYIQLQLCRRDTLKHELKKRERVDPRKSLKIFEEICLGVQVLHDNEMIHRDLKPANILFSLDKGAIKIGDLGLVVMKDQKKENNKASAITHVNSILEGSIHTGGIGTRLYMAPELREGLPYSYPIDIYALGVILLELFEIFSTQQERVTVILRASEGILPLSIRDNYSDVAALILNMLDDEPLQRPKIAQILGRCQELQLNFI
ncbi:Oidioi.mRNA.OKI2018_I69.chr2.g6338.t1.cds [Oikopleura dioica]|uniref:Oidioi.mRNA.OKI2018_I69.chr2.g6338.t1.cds n=1 Tax=Oikopleura dioica TaxID=34765 RepID=A0ABN7T9N2_OIKDI|nr:Oidioi.mRNA.OKI2018_I69.chr2.g6338.t1.cds [Oikopleura dioica]